jgi:hypothetical protein
MRFWVKAGITGILAVTAVFTAFWALRSIGAKAEGAPAAAYEWSCDEADAAFVLREYEGYVGVFEGGGGKTPLTVTDIAVDGLREADRDMLGAGIAVADRDELLTLLEDLGS